jgi:uncharacterized membrane protein YphA (DoxX/SURF4 family)
MSRSAVGLAAAVVVGCVLLVAAVSKLARPGEWRAQSAGLGVPWTVALFVPFVELSLGAFLLVQLQRHLVAWCAVALFVAFTALIALRLSQGRRPPCACFGSLSSKPIGPGQLVRNAVFIALAVLAATL